MNATNEKRVNLRRKGHGDSFARLVSLLFRNYRFILSISIVAAALTAAYSYLFIPKTYVSEARIMSISGSGSSLGGTIQGIADSAGVGGLLKLAGSGDETTRWLEIINGRELAGRVVERLDLLSSERTAELNLDLSDPRQKYRAEFILSSQMIRGRDASLENGVLSLQFESEDPEFSVKAVKAYLASLREFMDENSLTQAHATEEFIEGRLAELREELKAAEADMLALQQRSGVVELPSQSGLSLSQAAQLRTQLIEKDMEISLYGDILKDSAELQRKQRERQQIVEQLNKLVRGNGKGGSPDEVEVFTPLGEVPKLQMEFATAERRYLTLSSLVGFLEQQLELARIETKKNEPVFQIIDRPVRPIEASSPVIWLNALIAFIVGMFISVLGVLFMNFMRDEIPWRDERIIKLGVQKSDRRLRA